MIQSFAEETLARALAILGDARCDEDERADAACVLQVILRRVYPTEAEISDVMRALSTALDVPLAARWVLGGLVSLRPPVVGRLAQGIERLLEREYVAGRLENLAEVILVVLDEPVWAAVVREQWIHAAVADALQRLPESKTLIALLVGGWILARGDELGWVADLVEEHATLVTTGLLPIATRWHLHRAAPTVAGWRALSSARGPCPELDAALYGSRADIAVETLELAIGQTPDESRRITLARWLLALRGSAS